jgi:hypothetical protein
MVSTLFQGLGWLRGIGRDSLVFYALNDAALKIVKFMLFKGLSVSVVAWPTIAQLVAGGVVVALAVGLSAVANAFVQKHMRWAIGG